MRQILFSALIAAGLVMAAMAVRSFSEPAFGPLATAAVHHTSELITHVTAADGQSQFVTVIDPRQRVMAVYHVNSSTGQITPKSVRNFTWDLQMIEFNSGNPLPQDIRSGLQR